MQIRLSSCACIILFSVLFQGQVLTIADQDPPRTGPMKLKKGINGFISGTSKRIKFVENVFCSQIFKHTLCGNILIVFSCVFLVLDRSSSAVHSLTVCPLICSFMHFDQTHEIPATAHFLILAVIRNSLSFSVCHAWTVECQTTDKNPPLFRLFPAVFRSQFVSVCACERERERCGVGDRERWHCVWHANAVYVSYCTPLLK